MELNSFSQTDLQSALTEVRDLSELYIDGMVTPMRITLNEDRSYAVSLEKGRNYFGDMGTWGLDDEEHPTFLILHTMDDMGMVTDTLQYNLGAVVRPHDSILDIVYDRPLRRRPRLGLHLQLYTTVMKTLNISSSPAPLGAWGSAVRSPWWDTVKL